MSNRPEPRRIEPQTPLVDAMGGASRIELDVLDHGLVALVDVMPRLVPGGTTADGAIVQAARVSYGEGTKQLHEDRGLIRYLLRHRHTTPLEMVTFKFHLKLPLYVMRQHIRHRMACLAGSNELTFDLPSGPRRKGWKSYKLTMKQLYDRFHGAGDPSDPEVDGQNVTDFKRGRVKNMLLRSCDESDWSVYHTHITDVWESGIKKIIAVKLENGRTLRATEDHLCFTDQGWLRLRDALDRGVRFVGIGKSLHNRSEPSNFTPNELAAETWMDVPHYSGYEVSDLGRIRSWRGVPKGRLDQPKIKQMTVNPDGYEVVSLSDEGVSRAFPVHRLVMEAFEGPREEGRETRHLDSNRRNNRLSNLARGTAKENARDRMAGPGHQRLCVTTYGFVEWHEDGEEMTYDLSVGGPFHNFVAEGVFVHNSVNEYSARYSVLKDEFHLPEPEAVRLQSQSNRQGSEGAASSGDAEWFASTLEMLCDLAYRQYDQAIEKGVAREQARTLLPVNIYTECYWKIDLHNLLHYLALRCDEHAQEEIRAFADAILALVRPVVPVTVEAWEDYHPMRGGMLLTRLEVESLRTGQPIATENKREAAEWMEKVVRLGLGGQ